MNELSLSPVAQKQIKQSVTFGNNSQIFLNDKSQRKMS